METVIVIFHQPEDNGNSAMQTEDVNFVLQSVAVAAIAADIASQGSGHPSEANLGETSVLVNDAEKSKNTSGVTPTQKKSYRRAHRGNKSIVCKYCKKVFRSTHGHKAHLNLHTGEGGQTCVVCKRRFVSSSTYAHHMKLHKSGKGPSLRCSFHFGCTICGRRFSLERSLISHTQRFHICVPSVQKEAEAVLAAYGALPRQSQIPHTESDTSCAVVSTSQTSDPGPSNQILPAFNISTQNVFNDEDHTVSRTEPLDLRKKIEPPLQCITHRPFQYGPAPRTQYGPPLPLMQSVPQPVRCVPPTPLEYDTSMEAPESNDDDVPVNYNDLAMIRKNVALFLERKRLEEIFQGPRFDLTLEDWLEDDDIVLPLNTTNSV